jgi:predicted secreted Zn-dependent protease
VTAVRCRSYPITGSTITELAGQLDHIRDRRENARFAASTRWSVKWRYLYLSGPQGCSISNATAALRFTLVVPRWEAAESVDESLLREWNRFFAALWRHERGHVRNAVHAAKDIEQKLITLGGFSSCEELESRARGAARGVVKKYQRKDRAYDEATEHGNTQGALLIL